MEREEREKERTFPSRIRFLHNRLVTSLNTGELIDAAVGLGTKAGQVARDRAGSQGRLDRFNEQQEPENKKIDERRNN